ncbi:MAG: MarR family transcriptional regulator [Gammaproteobacteria bacterium]|nr:MarR family transcriptional regulator [Gammaproteobacteria bacterium]
MTDRSKRPQVFYLFLRHYQKIAGILETELREKGLTPGQYTVMSALQRFEPCTSAEIARKEKMTPQSMGEKLASLESKGFIERSYLGKNRRDLMVTRTEKGIKVQQECDAKVLLAEQVYMSRVPEEERNEFLDQLKYLHRSQH